MKITVRDYKKIYEFCKTPKTRAEIVDKLGINLSSVFVHTKIMAKAVLTEEKRSVNSKEVAFLVADKGVSDSDIVTLYQKHNKYAKPSDLVFNLGDEPPPSIIDFDDVYIKHNKVVKDGAITVKGGTMIVKGFDGIRVASADRKSAKVFVSGSSLQGF